MKLIHQILLIIITLLLVVIVYLAWLVWMPLKSEQAVFHIRSGDSASTIANTLSSQGIIRSRNMFVMLARLRHSQNKLKAGTYSFGGNYNMFQTLKMVEKGNTSAISITIPPGFNLHQTLQRMERSGMASYDSLLVRANDPELIYKLTGKELPSLEGYLFPDTYHFDLGSSIQTLLSIPVQNFFRQLHRAGIEPDSIPDFDQKLILASIVEKESAHPDERPIIAGVYWNRMQKGMRLESCPTVNYLLLQEGIKREVLTNSDLSIQSPYNTYLNAGLPPTPISNPSLQAIQAAISPQKHNYLFFVSNRKGRNDFSATYQEHLQKKRKYERSD